MATLCAHGWKFEGCEECRRKDERKRQDAAFTKYVKRTTEKPEPQRRKA